MTSTLTVLLLAFNIAAVYILDTYREDRIVPLLADGITGSMIEYIAMATGLIVIGHFSVLRAMIAVAGINTLLIAAIFALSRKMPKIKTRKAGIDSISGIIIVAGTAACFYRAGITMTSFHQDYYLYHAMSLMNYGVDDALATSCGNIDFYYGLPGYPSILAIGGAISGFSSVLGMQSLMTFAIGVYVYLIAERLGITGIGRYASIGCVLMSPIMISAGKSATEYVLLTLLAAVALREAVDFVYHSNLKGEVIRVRKRKIAIDPHATFITVIVPVFAMMLVSSKTLFVLPLITAVFCILYAYTGKVSMIVCSAAASFFQLAVILMSIKRFPNLFNHEWWRWLSSAGVDDFYGERIAITIASAWLFISVLLLLPAGRKTVKSLFADKNYFRGIGVLAALLAPVAVIKMYYIWSKEGSSDILLESSFAVIIMTGVLIIPGALLYILVRSRKLPVPAHLAILSTVTVYGLFVVCDSEVPYISSDRLELAPILPFMTAVVLLAAFAVSELGFKIKKQAVLFGMAAVLMLPMSLHAMVYRPETVMDFGSLQDIKARVEDGHNALFIDEGAQPLQFAIRLTCHTDVYLTGEQIPEGYDNIYVLTFDEEYAEAGVMRAIMALRCDYPVEGNPKDDLWAYYPVIGLKQIDDGPAIYLARYEQ